MYEYSLNTTDQRDLYARACGHMAQMIPDWSDAFPSDPAVTVLELASYLSDLQNREIDRFREEHYLAYLKLLGESPRQLAPAHLLAVPDQGDRPWPGMRFAIDGVPFEVEDVPEDGKRPIRLEQRHSRSRFLELAPPCQMPRAWEERFALRFFVSCGGGWREVEQREAQTGQTVRIVAAEPDFSGLYTLRALPSEEISLGEKGILRDSLCLMTEEDGIWYDCPVCRPQEGRTLPRGCQWDAARQTLRFGDGRDFRIPHGGPLLVAGCACSLGAGGNGAGGVLEQDGISLRSLRPAWGGQDAEDGRTAFFRTANEQELLLRAVSLADYEALALRTPGLYLDRVRAIPRAQLERGGAGVIVAAKPRASAPLPPLTRQQARRISAWLEEFRLIGVPVEVRGPRYCAIEVRVRVQFHGPPVEPALREAALQQTDGVTGPLGFGAELSYMALFAALGAVPGVKTVDALELRVLSEGGRRTQEGGVKLDADALSYLERFQLMQE